MSTIALLTRPGHEVAQRLIAAVASVLVFALGYQIGNLNILLAISLLPLVMVFVWQKPFLICILFVTLSYFRLQEAYSFLGPLRLPLLLGAAAVALTATKALLSEEYSRQSSPLMRAACIVSLIATSGLATVFFIMGEGASESVAVILVPLIVTSSIVSIVCWQHYLSLTIEHGLPDNIRLYVAYFAVVSLTMIVGYSPVNSYAAWSSTMVKIAAMTLAITWIARRSVDFSTAGHVFAISGTLLAVVVIYNQMHGLDLVEGNRVTIGGIDTYPRPVGVELGILSDPNDLALILLFPLAFVVARVVFSTSLMGAVAPLLSSGAIFWAISATKSRGALIGVIAVIMTISLLRWRATSSAIAVAVLAGAVTFGAMGLGARMGDETTAYAESGLDESSQARIYAWHTALKMALRLPLTGVGMGNFSTMYYSFTDYWDGHPRATHNMYLEVLAECGLIAFVLFVAMIITSFKINIKSLRRLEAAGAPIPLRSTSIALHAALMGTCASGTFLSQAQTWPVYVIVALMAALSTFARNLQPIDVAAVADTGVERRQPAIAAPVTSVIRSG